MFLSSELVCPVFFLSYTATDDSGLIYHTFESIDQITCYPSKFKRPLISLNYIHCLQELLRKYPGISCEPLRETLGLERLPRILDLFSIYTKFWHAYHLIEPIHLRDFSKLPIYAMFSRNILFLHSSFLTFNRH